MDKLKSIDPLVLMSGDPIDFGPLKIHQLTLKEIKQIGYRSFSRFTNLLTIDESQLLLFYEKEKISDGTTIPILYLYEQSIKNPTVFLEIKIGFFTYLKEEVFLDTEKKCFKFLVPAEKKLPNGEILKTKDFFFLDQTNFSQFQNIIRLINMDLEEEDDEIITDDLEMKEKFEKARRKLKLAKAKEKAKKAENGQQISVLEIISSLCAFGIGYNLFNIWDLTIYQLYDQFKRCQMKEDYNVGIKLISAGANSKEINLEHWIRKIT